MGLAPVTRQLGTRADEAIAASGAIAEQAMAAIRSSRLAGDEIDTGRLAEEVARRGRRSRRRGGAGARGAGPAAPGGPGPPSARSRASARNWCSMSPRWCSMSPASSIQPRLGWGQRRHLPLPGGSAGRRPVGGPLPWRFGQGRKARQMGPDGRAGGRPRPGRQRLCPDGSPAARAARPNARRDRPGRSQPDAGIGPGSRPPQPRQDRRVSRSTPADGPRRVRSPAGHLRHRRAREAGWRRLGVCPQLRRLDQPRRQDHLGGGRLGHLRPERSRPGSLHQCRLSRFHLAAEPSVGRPLGGGAAQPQPAPTTSIEPVSPPASPNGGRRSPSDHTWHRHGNGTTMQLVPRHIPNGTADRPRFSHSGGVANVPRQPWLKPMFTNPPATAAARAARLSLAPGHTPTRHATRPAGHPLDGPAGLVDTPIRRLPLPVG